MGKLNRNVILRQTLACGVALTLVAPAVPAGVALADESSSNQTATAANAEANAIASGKCGQNLTWTLDSGYNLVISGNGDMNDFDQGKTPWSTYQDVIQSVTIADGATNIGKNAFRECKSLESVHLADSVTSIGEDAFYNCQQLTTLNFPKNLVHIGVSAFFLTGITSVMLPEGFTTLDGSSPWGPFSGCDRLASVYLPSTLTSVPDGAFYDCDNLQKVMLPSSVTSVGDYAFANCDKLTDVYYTGNESDWSKISFGSTNGSFLKATRHYNYIPVSSISLSSNNLQLSPGATQKIDVHATPENAPDITWSSSDESVATVDRNGNVTANDYGSATITAQSPFGMTAQCEVVVPILVGNTITYEYSGDCSVSTSNPSVARPYITGTSTVTIGSYSRTTTTVGVDALKTGRVDITFTPTNGTAPTVKHLVVANPLRSITLSTDSLQMFEGDTQVITATLNPEDADDGTLDWSSSDESVAKVDGGKVAAVGSGSATITATNMATGVSSKANVQVYNANQNIAAAAVDPVPDQAYTGSPVEPELAVRSADGAQLKAGADYEVAYASNVDAGTATATVTGVGNYAGAKTVEFNIVYNSSFFSDVNESTPHYKDIMWLATTGISEGWLMPDGTREFRGMDTLKRQDMAAFLYRFAGSPAFDASAESDPFSDVDANTPHYREVLWLADSGISEGWHMPDGTSEFRGMQNLVRQDMAAFLQRLHNLNA